MHSTTTENQIKGGKMTKRKLIQEVLVIVALIIGLLFATGVLTAQADELQDLQTASSRANGKYIQTAAKLDLINEWYLTDTEAYVDAKRGYKAELERLAKEIGSLNKQIKALESAKGE